MDPKSPSYGNALDALVKHMRASKNIRFRQMKPIAERFAVAGGKSLYNKNLMNEASLAHALSKGINLQGAIRQGQISMARAMLQRGAHNHNSSVRRALAIPNTSRRRNMLRLVLEHTPRNTDLIATRDPTTNVIKLRQSIKDAVRGDDVHSMGALLHHQTLRTVGSLLEGPTLHYLLHLAATSCAPHVLKLLISHIPKTELRDLLDSQSTLYHMKTLLMSSASGDVACQRRGYSTIQVLLEAGARIDIVRPTFQSDRPSESVIHDLREAPLNQLALVLAYGSKQLQGNQLARLINLQPAIVQAITSENLTGGSLPKRIQLLLSYGADPNAGLMGGFGRGYNYDGILRPLDAMIHLLKIVRSTNDWGMLNRWVRCVRLIIKAGGAVEQSQEKRYVNDLGRGKLESAWRAVQENVLHLHAIEHEIEVLKRLTNAFRGTRLTLEELNILRKRLDKLRHHARFELGRSTIYRNNATRSNKLAGMERMLAEIMREIEKMVASKKRAANRASNNGPPNKKPSV